MPESVAELTGRLRRAVAPGFRDRILDKGLARGLIWRDGVLPEGAPAFPDGLTTDLLDYAYAVMALSLRLRSQQGTDALLERAFLVSGEAIESAIHNGNPARDQGFHRVTAAVAFHLARYAARSYSMLPSDRASGNGGGDNLSPTEQALVHLLRRRFDEMHSAVASWLLSEEHDDGRIAARLAEDAGFDEDEAIHNVLTTAFMRGLAWFDHALVTGVGDSAANARRQLAATAESAADFRAASHWWTATLARHLIDELWQLTLHERIPALPSTVYGFEDWDRLRRDYIQRLRAGKRSAVELWPSQLDAAKRTLDLRDDLVVALPTSAGKTRIAELCILRCLATGNRIVYVTPLRALSAQVERDLAETFMPLGFSVSSLYGAAGIDSGDARTLREGTIVVSTPEKLDFALRNDPSIIDDVGLIVFDEGHMLGPNEREVRYEALVQRILRRDDAFLRRIVCLSALFPDPQDMQDLVGWIRQDEPGEPVHSTWRPTRQRFGLLQWSSNAARLELQVAEENPYVPRFVKLQAAPSGSRRRKPFPANKNELTLAAAWRFVEQEKAVLIYCALRKPVETLGAVALKCIEHLVLRPLGEVNQRIQSAMAIGVEWLGPGHPAVECLRYGIALHHGGLPRPFLSEVEGLLRSGDCRVTIASPTLAQGLNLSASVLLVPSIWRNQHLIPATELANVAGRAGRAFVDLEGLVLHVIWESVPFKARYARRNWQQLVAQARAPHIASGLLTLAVNVFERVGRAAGIPLAEVLDYLTGSSAAWDFDAGASDVGVTAAEWERDLASFDAAILALLDGDTERAGLESAIEEVLKASLFSRELARKEAAIQSLIRRFVVARADLIWSQTTPAQRKGYHAAGVGFRAGQFLDQHLDSLVDLLRAAESAVDRGDAATAGVAAVKFAELVFRTAPFRPPREMPAAWPKALIAWIAGHPAADVVKLCGDDGVDVVQEALMYRLPWAMEATRVHAIALGRLDSTTLRGVAALAVESGSANKSVISLLRAGLASREAAIAAVATTRASFDDSEGRKAWLQSDEIKAKTEDEGWPTIRSHQAWLDFYRGEVGGRYRKWNRERQVLEVEWSVDTPQAGTAVIVESSRDNEPGLVLSPDFSRMGVTKTRLARPQRNIVGARVEEDVGGVSVEFFGPPFHRWRS